MFGRGGSRAERVFVGCEHDSGLVYAANSPVSGVVAVQASRRGGSKPRRTSLPLSTSLLSSCAAWTGLSYACIATEDPPSSPDAPVPLLFTPYLDVVLISSRHERRINGAREGFGRTRSFRRVLERSRQVGRRREALGHPQRRPAKTLPTRSLSLRHADRCHDCALVQWRACRFSRCGRVENVQRDADDGEGYP